jgi:hypothetical protein
MIDNFFIKKDATLPTLRLELVLDGKYDFMKSSHFNNAIQNADVTFSMIDEHDVLKISNAPCNLVLVDQDTCDEKYIIEYRWKQRDTRVSGHYKGKIKITFMDDIYENHVTYEGGTFIGPIYEELDIFIKD